MKKQFLATVATLSLIITLAVTGFASWNAKLTVKIPFDFVVKGKTLPAGTYTITPGNVENLFIISSRENRVALGTLTMKVADKDKAAARLIFRRYGTQCFLAQVYDGYSNGRELPKSNAERAAAKGGNDHLAQQVEPELITLAAQTGQ